jgi:transposase
MKANFNLSAIGFPDHATDPSKISETNDISDNINSYQKQLESPKTKRLSIDCKAKVNKRLSLDEFARRKGQGNFATILTDLDTSSLLEVIDSHKSDDIIAVLKQQPLAMREGVAEVCVDMWGGFPKVIREK